MTDVAADYQVVTLNALRYAVTSHITEDNANEFAAVINQTPPQYDARQPPISTFTMNSWTGGLGIKWADFREHQGRFYYGSDIDTRFANQLTLGPLLTDASGSLTSGSNNTTTTPSCYCFFNGKEYFAVRDKVWSWDATTLTEVLDVGTATVNSLAKFTNAAGVSQIYAFLQGSNAFYFSDTGDNADWAQGTSTLGIFGLSYDGHFIIIGGTDTATQIDAADNANGAL